MSECHDAYTYIYNIVCMYCKDNFRIFDDTIKEVNIELEYKKEIRDKLDSFPKKMINKMLEGNRGGYIFCFG